MRACLYLTGQTFGGWTVLAHDKAVRYKHFWRCQCQCGEVHVISGSSLMLGRSRSCGCLAKAGRADVARRTATKHGMRYTRLYSIWTGMKKRCHYPKHKHYDNYGGRGISVCEAWRMDFSAFAAWALSPEREPAYAAGLTIDRIDVDGNYEPDNCRWATRSEQERAKWREIVRRREQNDAAEHGGKPADSSRSHW